MNKSVNQMYVGITMATRPFLPAKVSNPMDTNRFLVEFLESIKKQPSPKEDQEGYDKNVILTQRYFRQYMEYVKKTYNEQQGI